jgi:hypothetical protein
VDAALRRGLALVPGLDVEAVDGDAELQAAAAPTRTIREPKR